MSSDPKPAVTRRLALLGLVALAGCGLRPLYGPAGGATAFQGAVGFVLPQDSDGYVMRTKLEDRFGSSDSPQYWLTVTFTSQDGPAAIAVDTSIARRNLEMTAEFELRSASGEMVTSGTVSAFGGYSNTGTTVATRAAERDTRERVLTSLADLILARVNTHAASMAG